MAQAIVCGKGEAQRVLARSSAGLYETLRYIQPDPAERSA